MLGEMGSTAGHVSFFLVYPHFCFTSYENSCTIFLYFPYIYNRPSLCGPIARGAIVDPTSEVYLSLMLVLLVVGNWKLSF
jgi:hypothetical protein